MGKNPVTILFIIYSRIILVNNKQNNLKITCDKY